MDIQYTEWTHLYASGFMSSHNNEKMTVIWFHSISKKPHISPYLKFISIQADCVVHPNLFDG
jgi:hypothetical protein